MKQFSLIFVTIIFIYHQVNAQIAYHTVYERPPAEDEQIILSGLPVAYVVLEPNLNYGRCDKTCGTVPNQYPSDKSTRYDAFDTFYYAEKYCGGRIQDCVSANANLNICYADTTNKKYYDWLEREGHNNYRNSRFCPRDRSFTVHSWIQFPNRCDICICKCVPHFTYPTDVRALYFKSIVSDIQKNKVVTNLRFVESEGMIQIQIKEGEIKESNGDLTTANSAWVHPRKILQEPHYYKNFYEANLINKIESTNGTNSSQTTTTTEESILPEDMIVPDDQAVTTLIKGSDYDRVTIQDIVYLDDVIVPNGHVVTGVRLGEVQISNETRAFQLEVRATLYDSSTKKLSNKLSHNTFDTSFWMTSNRTGDHDTRTEYKLQKDGSDSLDVNDDLRDSHHHQYVKIRTSGLSDDGGQSIIPYFDSRPTMLGSGPLRGVGLCVRGYGRIKPYLTLKPIPYNWS